MPVLLTKPKERRTWLEAPVDQALELQRPLLDDEMKVIAEGARLSGAAGGRADPISGPPRPPSQAGA
ncbi:hypothetical protein AX289_17395 [Methylorubrum populi]|nr:hypothetical protein AX289_17395 [Methylorubrum populi]